MLNEHLAQLWTNVHSIENFSIRLYEPDALHANEAILIKNGLFMLLGIALEKASVVLEESKYLVFKGRLLKLPALILERPEGFSSFLSLLDEVDDIVTKTISSVSSEFKAQTLLLELHHALASWSPHLWRTFSDLFSSILSNNLDAECVRFFRQLSNLLSKIHIDRSDLLSEHYSEYFYSEDLLFAETSVQLSGGDRYWDLVLGIRSQLSEVISRFDDEDILPKHGPGAVADVSVKNKFEKYSNIGFDARIDYMLRRRNKQMSDYSPYPLVSEDRTSRVIFVPKTWKKLRGISAEPVGLQFFQQAIYREISKAISKTELRHVINFHDQDRSRELALEGSCNGNFSTIDLSAASDSVTTQLVRDIFGNTNLCRWLLATRSTHTLIDNQRLEINKFAPMGSACCFPVECLVFAGLTLHVAAKRSRSTRLNYRKFRVFGDDIICPTSITDEVMESLSDLGFTVNTEKSYWSGDYRESCGMDAWKGFDVTPLKLKDFSFDFNGSKPCSYEHHSRVISYLNTLYNSGYKNVRSFFLKKFLNSRVRLGKANVKVQNTLVFGDGSHGTLVSCQPDNFHLTVVPITGYQRYGYKYIGWKPRKPILSSSDELHLDEVHYFEWLMRSARSQLDGGFSYDLEFFRKADSETASGGLKDPQMVPTVSRFDPWFPVG